MSILNRVFNVLKSSFARVSETRPAAPESRSTVPSSPRTLDYLDVARFVPLAHAETRELIGKGGSRWRGVSSAAISRIPSGDLPEIELIDRAMAGQGFITPEELAEIHDIGAQMDRARGEDAYFKELAELALARAGHDREHLKARKKAEAAARSAQRAAEVAFRRRNDILYLGRGVSRSLGDRRVNVEKLRQWNLPLLAAPKDLADAMSIDIPTLRWLAFHAEAPTMTHYIRFTIPKKSGGEREIFAPHRKLAQAQSWILTQILEKIPVHDAAHGFVKGRSTVTNARLHVHRSVLLVVDLDNFFPTIAIHRVMGIFRRLGYSPAISWILALLCTECRRHPVEYMGQTHFVAVGPRVLPQGACTSPALSNLTAAKMDARFTGLSRKLGWTYSRYADDMTFSAVSPETQAIGYLTARIRHIVAEEGFRLNTAKTRVLKPNTAQKVTGIVVNQRPGVPRRLVKRLRAILHQAETQGLAAQNREQLPHFDAWLQGMIAYVSMVNPDQGAPLSQAFNKLSR